MYNMHTCTDLKDANKIYVMSYECAMMSHALARLIRGLKPKDMTSNHIRQLLNMMPLTLLLFFPILSPALAWLVSFKDHCPYLIQFSSILLNI